MTLESDNRPPFLGYLNFRDFNKKFGIKKSDRRYHMYLIGQTGTGKTSLMANLLNQDIQNGEGLAILDPHGDMVSRIAKNIPDERAKDLIYLNVSDPNSPYGFNPLASVPVDQRPMMASAIVEAFQKIWEGTWGPRMEHFFLNGVLTLLDQPTATLSDLGRIFDDSGYRNSALTRVTNPEVRNFWYREYPGYPLRYRSEAIAPIRNKVGAFISDPNLHRVLTSSPEMIDVRKVMDEGKILLVNLAKGNLGSKGGLLGSLLVSRIGTAALSRADQPEDRRRDFYLYLDEFQNFTTLSLANMLSELRKYRLNMVLAHQYLGQLEPEVREAILGNVGSIISFRVGPEDARLLAKYFQPKFTDADLMILDNYSIYLRLMIDGAVSKPFSAVTMLSWTDSIARAALAYPMYLLRPLAGVFLKTGRVILSLFNAKE